MALWRELAREAEDPDLSYIEEFKAGFNVVGPIARSGVWPAMDRPAVLKEADLEERLIEAREESKRKQESLDRKQQLNENAKVALKRGLERAEELEKKIEEKNEKLEEEVTMRNRLMEDLNTKSGAEF